MLILGRAMERRGGRSGLIGHVLSIADVVDVASLVLGFTSVSLLQ
jgi:hypothetical protein